MSGPVLVFRWILGRWDSDGRWTPGRWAVLPGVCPPDDGEIGASFDEGQYRRLHTLRTQVGRGERDEWLGEATT